MPYPHSEIESKWQRYWSEYDTFATQNPTPKTVLILHGWGSNSTEHWFPTLKKNLTERGYIVFVPDLPTSAEPNLDAQMEFLENYKNTLESDSIIIGHSLGAKLACHFLAKHSISIGKLILIAPTYDIIQSELTLDEPASVIAALDTYNRAPVNLASIHTDTVTYLSDNDPYIRVDSAKNFYNTLPQKAYKIFTQK